MTDKAERTGAKSSGGGGRDDGEQLHTRASRVVTTSSHRKRFKQSHAMQHVLSNIKEV